MTVTMEKSTDYLIVGGGISGLFLAMLLQQNHKNCLVLERDTDLDSRSQGYSLTMQGRTKEILEELCLMDDVLKLGCPSVEHQFYISDGKLLRSNKHITTKKFNYPVPRQALRKLFLSRLAPDTVQWQKIAKEVHATHVICQDETKYQYLILVACDGIHSTIRKLLLPQISLQQFTFPSTPTLVNIYGLFDLNSETEEFFRKRTIQVVDGTCRFFSKPFDATKQMWEITYPFTNAVKEPGIRELLLQIIAHWQISYVRQAIESTPMTSIIVNTLFDYCPKIEDFKDLPNNVVFIGDAIHPMAPFIGMGANEALLDCYDFVSSRGTKENSDRNLKAYHEHMCKRVAKSVTESRKHVDFYHSVAVTDPQQLFTFKGWT